MLKVWTEINGELVNGMRKWSKQVQKAKSKEQGLRLDEGIFFIKIEQ